MPISDDPHRFDPGSRLFRADGSELVVAGSHRHRNRLLVKFDGIDSRNAAEELRGSLFVDAAHIRPLGEDEFWDFDLIGCRVEQKDGTDVGEVIRVESGTAQDLIVVSTNVGERLIPAVKEIVTAVDIDARRVVIDPPAGLLD